MGAHESYDLVTFCWVDLVTSDQVAAGRFYAGLLGQDVPEGDRHVHSGCTAAT